MGMVKKYFTPIRDGAIRFRIGSEIATGRIFRNIMKKPVAAMLLACGGLQACGFAGTDGAPTIAGGLQAEMREIRRSMEQEVGEASARRIDQCRVLRVGEKACGGPQAYLIYSTAVSSERKLQELARQYTEAEEKYNRVTGAMSTCSYVLPPEPQLRNGKCTGKRNEARDPGGK